MDLEVKKAVDALNKGDVILYPTDTVWGIGCDATNPIAVEKVYKIKKRKEKKPMLCLIEDLNMLKLYLDKIPVEVKSISNQTKPTSIIYPNPKGFAKNLISYNKTIGIRIPKHNFCNKLLKRFGKPIVSTSANISFEKTPTKYSQINLRILEEVDHIVNLEKDIIKAFPSRIYKIDKKGKLILIRQ
ncbi:MAG: threonylcarbamoyl-AMP synthase [Flavobacteriaceae bacterium]|nr:threonylcarbamoyl-AMP synthase [Flavobacteriaceae bacterium]